MRILTCFCLRCLISVSFCGLLVGRLLMQYHAAFHVKQTNNRELDKKNPYHMAKSLSNRHVFSGLNSHELHVGPGLEIFFYQLREQFNLTYHVVINGAVQRAFARERMASRSE